MTLVAIFIILLLGILVLAGLSLGSSVGWVKSGLSQVKSLGEPLTTSWNNLFTKKINQTYSLAKGELIDFTANIGNVTIRQGKNNQVQVLAQVGFGGLSTQDAKLQAENFQLTRSGSLNGLQLTLGNVAGLNHTTDIRKVEVQVIVPANAVLQIDDHLGNVYATGKYHSIQVQDDLGNITLSGNSVTSTVLSDNMGNISFQGDPGVSSNFTNNMGNVSLVFVGKRNLQVNATTDLGNISGSLGQLTVQSSHHWTGTTGNGNGGTPTGTVSVSNNLGNISLNEVNNG